MIGEQFFAEEKINTEDIYLDEISGEVVLNVLEELSLTEIFFLPINQYNLFLNKGIANMHVNITINNTNKGYKSVFL